MTASVNDYDVGILNRHTDRGEPLLPGEPTTLPELFLQAVKKHDLSDALNYKTDGEWRSISSVETMDRSERIP